MKLVLQAWHRFQKIFKGALSTAATRLMDSLCEDEIQGAHKKEFMEELGEETDWFTKDVTITFSHILDFIQ